MLACSGGERVNTGQPQSYSSPVYSRYHHAVGVGQSDGQWDVSKSIYYLSLSRPLVAIESPWTYTSYIFCWHTSEEGQGGFGPGKGDRIWHGRPQRSTPSLLQASPSWAHFPPQSFPEGSTNCPLHRLHQQSIWEILAHMRSLQLFYPAAPFNTWKRHDVCVVTRWLMAKDCKANQAHKMNQ